jgi:hypothetical protein
MNKFNIGSIVEWTESNGRIRRGTVLHQKDSKVYVQYEGSEDSLICNSRILRKVGDGGAQ